MMRVRVLLQECWCEVLVLLLVLIPALVLIMGGDFSQADLSLPVLLTAVLALLVAILGRQRRVF